MTANANAPASAPTVRWRRAIRGAFAGLALVAVLLVALGALGAFVRAAVAPLPGEWTVPLRLGPVQLQAGVPSLVRLATAPWLAPLLDGRSLSSRAGRVRITRMPDGRTLAVHCAPCALRVPGMGNERVVIQDLRVTVRREGEQLFGEVAAGALRAQWQGQLTKRHIHLTLQMPATPIREAYALLGPSIPELGRAVISGTVAMQAALSLPDGPFKATPQLVDFQVQGLGTAVLGHAQTRCSAGVPGLTSTSWLARAVIAAEDQRFYEHPGFDLLELATALDNNQQGDDSARIRRGASTLTQQTAKLLLTGSERSPVRKLREVLYAVEMEQTLGKARILQLYLANAPWGPGLCGAEAAAQHYFGRKAVALTPGQAAWLAAMLHNPGMEADRWAQSGHINLARAQSVLRGMGRLPRKHAAAELAALRYPLTTAMPARYPCAKASSNTE